MKKMVLKVLAISVLMAIFTVILISCDGPEVINNGGTAPIVTTDELPNGKINTTYSQWLYAFGDYPISWSIYSDSLPTGLNLSEEGEISGKPVEVGFFNFTVIASNATGSDMKELSIDILGEVPDAVTSFEVTVSGYRQVDLTWTAPSNNGGSPIINYEITNDYWENKVIKTASETTHTYTDLTNGTYYTFQIRAVNTQGVGIESSESLYMPTVPGKVDIFAVLGGNERIVLLWTAPLYYYGVITGYELTSDNWTTKIDKSATDTMHTFTNLTNGTSYTVQIRAINAQGVGVEYSATLIPKIIETELIKVEAGNFLMGKNGAGTQGNVEPVHNVTLTQGFYIGKYEVTQKLWKAVMAGSLPYFIGPGGVSFTVNDNYPVYCIDWYMAIRFCNILSLLEGLSPVYSIKNSTNPAVWGTIPQRSLTAYREIKAIWDAVEIVEGSTGYRLPTEAQWEYAAKGGHKASNPYKIYPGSDNAADVGWFGYDQAVHAIAVGSYTSNELGIYDMLGNMREWCWDRYYFEEPAYPDESQIDPIGPIGPSSGYSRVIRGGGHNNLFSVKSVDRSYDDQIPYNGSFSNGLRILRPAD